MVYLIGILFQLIGSIESKYKDCIKLLITAVSISRARRLGQSLTEVAGEEVAECKQSNYKAVRVL